MLEMKSTRPGLTKTNPLYRFLGKYKLLLAILVFGFLVRMFQLGQDILWYDEVGVYGITKVKSLADIVPIVQSHVMAMPLDYVITWLISHLGSSNAILRFPSVVWGMFTLPVCYLFFKELSNSRTAIYSTLLLAISPFHIQYSQELRFYASLTFFYLLSTYTLFQAMKNPEWKRWLIFTVITIIGVYFHVFVLLVLANGLIWFLFGKETKENRQIVFRFLVPAATIILLAFTAGFFAFSGRVTFANPFLDPGLTFTQALFMGLGWLPFYSNSPELAWVWGLVSLLLQIWGVMLLMRNPRSPSALLAISTFIQIGVIIGLDLFKQYFFMPRQLLLFLPILMYVAGLAVSDLDRRLSNWTALSAGWISQGKAGQAVSALLVSVLLLINLPALATYYNGTKGNADKITTYIYDSWRSGSKVLVINPYYAGYFNYFFSDVIKDETIIPSVWQADWNTVRESKSWQEKVYVISPIYLSPDLEDILEISGYRLISFNQPFSRYNFMLWVKDS